jgi:hypothetical protein
MLRSLFSSHAALHHWVIDMTRHLSWVGPVMEAASCHILLFLCVLVWPLLNIHSPVGDQWCSALKLLPFHQVTDSKLDVLVLIVS